MPPIVADAPLRLSADFAGAHSADYFGTSSVQLWPGPILFPRRGVYEVGEILLQLGMSL